MRGKLVASLQVIAKAYDNPIPGYKTATVGNLRLWEATPVDEFDLTAFNEGKYDKASTLRLSLIALRTSFCIVGFQGPARGQELKSVRV